MRIEHPDLQRLFDYWDSKRGARKMPSRADLDPLDLAFIIGNVILIDVIAGSPPGFRIRLHGTNLTERVGYELTGKMLDELPQAEFRELARLSFSKVAAIGEPLHALNDRLLDGQTRRYETIILPMSSDGSRVDMLLCGLIYEHERR
ncbi:MAG TPA: PAS domain-containing protein [Stellaceae bacterium]